MVGGDAAFPRDILTLGGEHSAHLLLPAASLCMTPGKSPAFPEGPMCMYKMGGWVEGQMTDEESA